MMLTTDGVILAAAFAGLIAGATHVLLGPDHLAAVAPLAVRRPQRSWLTGVRWGAGHAAGVTLVALVGWLFRETISIDVISARSERIVGVMLIGIGAWGLRRAFDFKVHVHRHAHGDLPAHDHIHFHSRADHSHGDGAHHVHGHAAIGVGVLHGLAGGAHFVGVLPALAMPTRFAAAIYILSFGAGTVLAMGAFSQAFGTIGLRALAWGGASAYRRVMSACGAASIAIGVYWLLI